MTDHVDFALANESCIYLRDSNVKKIATLTEYTEEELLILLDKAKLMDKSIVRIPLKPRDEL